MKIDTATIKMTTSHGFSQTHFSQEKLLIKRATEGITVPERQFDPHSDQLELSSEALNPREPATTTIVDSPTSQHNKAGATGKRGLTIELSPEDRQKIKILEHLWQQLTGKKIHLQVIERLNIGQTGEVQGEPADTALVIEYQFHEEYREEEKLAFNSAGTVKTKDGRKIDFQLALEMKRKYVQQNDFKLLAGNQGLIDPLIINYASPAAGLTTDNFAFDLNQDGEREKISFPKAGSGFLVLDKNGDGIINDGGELFGPGSGDGFKELSRYDADGNHWLDENDPIFDRLQIWPGNDHGARTYLSLRGQGIGAIYLGAADTAFSLKDGQNQLLGQVRSTGLFLREDGTAGSVQQVDLAV